MGCVTEKREFLSIAVCVAVSIAAAFCGGAFELLIDNYLFPRWFNLGWWRPVGEWLITTGCGDTVAAYLGLMWDRLPEWLIAVFLGVCAGSFLRKKWPIGAIPCALAFALTSHLFLLFAGEENPVLSFGLSIATRTALWELPSIVLLVLAASVSSRIEGVREREGCG